MQKKGDRGHQDSTLCAILVLCHYILLGRVNAVEPVPDILIQSEESTLLAIVRRTLQHYFQSEKKLLIPFDALSPALRAPRGAFVTLRHKGRLRGCTGFTRHRIPLAITVRDSALNSARNDPRFPRVLRAESAELSIELSVLGDGVAPDSPLIPVRDVETIRIGRDGLYIEDDKNHRGLLLPQIAVEHQWNRLEFLEAVCKKAHLPNSAWGDAGTHVQRFTAQVFDDGL